MKQLTSCLALFIVLISSYEAISSDNVEGATLKSSKLEKNLRDSKQWGLFTVLSFPNSQCTSTINTGSNPNLGLCYTKEECREQGGSQQGNCAMGFGVCCVFQQTGCDLTVNRNCTYAMSTGYPTDYQVAASVTQTEECTINVNKVKSDVCQIRLDLIDFVLLSPGNGAQPADAAVGGRDNPPITGAGRCDRRDSMTIQGPTARNPPIVCGMLSGQHVYVETGLDEAAGTRITINVNGQIDGLRKWKIKISQLECNTNYRAPQGCVQYFMEPSGAFQSYGYQNSQMLVNQMYATCFRKNLGMCTINFSQTLLANQNVGTNREMSSFALSEPMNGMAVISSSCSSSYVIIANVFGSTDFNAGQRSGGGGANGGQFVVGPEFCGGALSKGGNAIAAESDDTGGLIQSNVFMLQTVAGGAVNDLATADDGDAVQFSANAPITGYSIRYQQSPCTGATQA